MRASTFLLWLSCLAPLLSGPVHGASSVDGHQASKCAEADASCDMTLDTSYSSSFVGTDADVSSAQATVYGFLANGQQAEGTFKIQGWRWHTLSLVRELLLLKEFASSLTKDQDDNIFESLEKAVDYVIGFNMKGLHRVENELFFPWLEEKLSLVEDLPTRNAFLDVFEYAVAQQKKIAELGATLVS